MTVQDFQLRFASKNPCRVASTADVDIVVGGLISVDGVTVSAGDRVLLRAQTAGAENGIYLASSGSWARSLDMDSVSDDQIVAGLSTYVQEGTANAGKTYTLTTTGTITLDTTALTLVEKGEVGGVTGATDNSVLRADGTGGSTLQNSTVLIDDTGNITPSANDGSALGTSSLAWADLFLASGGVINLSNGDVTLTHSANTLTFAGATSGYIFDDGNLTTQSVIPDADNTWDLGSASLSWANLYLASVIHHKSDLLWIENGAKQTARLGVSGFLDLYGGTNSPFGGFGLTENRIDYSEDLTSGNWGTPTAGSSVTANDTAAPNGQATADKFEVAAGSASGGYLLRHATGLTAATTYTVYFWAKKGTGTFDFKVDLGDGTDTGVIPLTTEWQRYRYVLTSGVVGTATDFLIAGHDLGTASMVWLWGVQICLGDVERPYLATVGTSFANADRYGLVADNAQVNTLYANAIGDGAAAAVQIGNDGQIWDLNLANTIGFRGTSDATVAQFRMGSSGTYLMGNEIGLHLGGTSGVEAATARLEVDGIIDAQTASAGPILMRARGGTQEVIWYDGTYFSWGFGASHHYFADSINVGGGGGTAPTEALEVHGGIVGNAAKSGIALAFQVGDAMLMYDENDGWTTSFRSVANAGHAQFEMGSNNAYIYGSPGGFIGVSTTTLTAPQALLDVDGELRVTGSYETDVIDLVKPVYIRGTGQNHNANRVVRIGNDEHVNGTGIGLALTILTASTHALVGTTTYNTFNVDADKASLATALDNLTRDQIGILTSYDAWEPGITANALLLYAAAERLGLFRLANYRQGGFRHPYAAIFRGAGTATGNTEIQQEVWEVVWDEAAGNGYGEIRTWMIGDGFMFQQPHQALVGVPDAGSVFRVHGNDNIQADLRLDFTSANTLVPSFTSYSAGTRLVLLENISGSSAGYAMGVGPSRMWQTVNTSANTKGFDFYGGTTRGGSLRMAGGGLYLLEAASPATFEAANGVFWVESAASTCYPSFMDDTGVKYRLAPYYGAFSRSTTGLVGFTTATVVDFDTAGQDLGPNGLSWSGSPNFWVALADAGDFEYHLMLNFSKAAGSSTTVTILVETWNGATWDAEFNNGITILASSNSVFHLPLLFNQTNDNSRVRVTVTGTNSTNLSDGYFILKRLQ